MKRLVFFERSSSICLYDQVFGSWKGEATSSTISKTCSFFVQMAQEIDAGDLIRVQFSSESFSAEKKTFKSRFETFGRPAIPKNNAGTNQNSSNSFESGVSGLMEDFSSLEMISSSSEHSQVCACVFFEKGMPIEYAKQFADKALNIFLSNYKTQISDFQSVFDMIATAPEKPYDQEAILNSFMAFRGLVDSLVSELTALS